MSRNKSEFVSAAGTAFEIIKALSEEVHAHGGTDTDLRKIVISAGTRAQIAEILVKSDREIHIYPLTVNYSRTRAEMIAAGDYSYIDPDITQENFPVGQGDGEVEAVLVHCAPGTPDEKLLSQMEWRGLRPATMDELCAFGEQYVDLQGDYSIYALGSTWDKDKDHHHYLGALAWSSIRQFDLRLDWWRGSRGRHDRFLAVRI